jgi:hypothetical protein
LLALRAAGKRRPRFVIGGCGAVQTFDAGTVALCHICRVGIARQDVPGRALPFE